jgi:hypothetical protein
MVDRHPAVIDRARMIKFTRQSIFPAFLEIPLRQLAAEFPDAAESGRNMRSQHRSLVCNLAARKPSPHPKGGEAAESGKHPVEIGHDEIEVRFAPISRRLGVDPVVRPAVYFQHILEILQQSACSAKFSRIRRRRPRDIWS